MKSATEAATLVAGAAALAFLCAAPMEAGAAGNTPGKQIAKLALFSDLNDASSEYWVQAAIAENLPTKQARKEATNDAKDELEENIEDAQDQHDARVDVSRWFGGGRYNPVINPANFLTPAQVAANPNPFMPLVPGKTRVYRSITDEGTEIVRVHVSDQTRVIMGVTCIVVHDEAKLDGVLIEDTLDWLAQDIGGNVWYFGEQSLEYENGKVSSIDGSWEAGEDGALPGIVMLGNPAVGNLYRQEFAIGEAEDLAKVLALDASETVPYGSFSNCLKTAEYTPLEPDNLERKFFASGVGEILAIDVGTGNREELIDIETE